jgi:MarR family transcriptional regulator, transcriptional regulator for hemolysin
MNKQPVIPDLVWLIADTTRLLQTLLSRRLSGFGLTRSQWEALAKLYTAGPVSQSALAGIAEVKCATIAGLVYRLEAAGWIERSADQRDRRMKVVSLTDKAQAVMVDAATIVRAAHQEVFVDVSARNLEALSNSLSVIKRQLNGLLSQE